jgi:membrane protease YdiL (CAAX protease family)
MIALPINTFEQTHPASFIQRHVYPVVRVVYQGVIEIVKVVAAQVFLELLTSALLGNQSKMAFRMVRLITVVAPVIEEILFRGILQRGINLCQNAWFKFILKREPTEKELCMLRAIRIQLSAIIFAVAHLKNPHKNLVSKLMQFTWSYIGGVAYGYLSDKYKTVSVSILAHGINNTAVVYLSSIPNANLGLCLSVIAVNPVVAYLLGKDSTREAISGQIKSGVQHCLRWSDRLVTWARPLERAVAA